MAKTTILKTREIFYGPQGDRMELVVDRDKASISNIDLFDAGLPILKHPESPKILIENLKVCRDSEGHIKLQVGKDRAIEITRSQLGFRGEKKQGDWEQWRLFERFLNGNGNLKLKGDRSKREKIRNMIVQINKKLIDAINSTLGARIPHKTKLYQYDREQEIYKFKFLVVHLAASRCEKLTEKELLSEMELMTQNLRTGRNIKDDYERLQELCAIASVRGLKSDNPIYKNAKKSLEDYEERRSCF